MSKQNPKTTTALRVTAKRDGFRRAGRAWPSAGTIVPLDTFDEEQLAQLRSDPMLVVEEAQIPAEPETEPGK